VTDPFEFRSSLRFFGCSRRRVGVFGSFFFRVSFLSPYNLTFQLQIWNFSFLRLFNTDSKSNPSHPFAKTTKG
jgi:hypothetical protein